MAGSGQLLRKVVGSLSMRLRGQQSAKVLPVRYVSESSSPPSSSSSSPPPSSSSSTPPSQYGALFGVPSDANKAQQVFRSGYESVDVLKNASENVRKIFDLEFASRRERGKREMAQVIDAYKRQKGDTGSIEVQVATLTLRIKQLTEHLQAHRKDKSCLRGLIQLVQRRRILLLVLKEFKPNLYHKLLTELKLRPPVVTKYQYKTRKGKKLK